jgi:hypothetical protein
MDTTNDNSQKPYSISFENRPNYLYVYVSGEHDSYEISRRYWQEVAGECARLNASKVLIEEDIAEAVSIGEMYRLATEIPELGFFGIFIAFVDRYIEHHDLNQFGELVVNNRGVFGKIFNDVEAAEKWLLSEQ